tara:strand:+ start:85 stop:1233 length:1149 start_codon:yes stop_codon:yes gene_type:complete
MGLLKETAHNYYSGNDLGSYQFISLENIINNFMISYVGEDKIISKVKRTDVLFHARRALQELSYDTFKSIKSQEITLPPSLVMPIPQDYVNYVKVCWSDSSGIEHTIYPASKTSNPNSLSQDGNDNYIFTDQGDLYQFPMEVELEDLSNGINSFDFYLKALNTNANMTAGEIAPDTNPIKAGMEIVSPHFPVGTKISSVGTNDPTSGDFYITTDNNSVSTAPGGTVKITILDKSDTWDNYKDATPSENTEDYQEDTYWPHMGGRFGLDPKNAQANGSFFIDSISGKIHFSSNINGKTVILKYISDSLGTDAEMQVHKLAEEAMYKWIAHAILASKANVQEYLVNRFKKERFAEVRKAKLRLSNLKIEELTQIMRGKSKFIKH